MVSVIFHMNLKYKNCKQHDLDLTITCTPSDSPSCCPGVKMAEDSGSLWPKGQQEGWEGDKSSFSDLFSCFKAHKSNANEGREGPGVMQIHVYCMNAEGQFLLVEKKGPWSLKQHPWKQHRSFSFSLLVSRPFHPVKTRSSSSMWVINESKAEENTSKLLEGFFKRRARRLFWFTTNSMTFYLVWLWLQIQHTKLLSLKVTNLTKVLWKLKNKTMFSSFITVMNMIQDLWSHRPTIHTFTLRCFFLLPS